MGQMMKYAAVVTILILAAATSYLILDNIALRGSSSGNNPITLEQLEELNTTSSDRVALDIVSGTEYSPNDAGQFIVRIADQKSNPLSGSCYANIAYPDKSMFVTNQTMSASVFSGNYYLGFTVPSNYGIYEELVTCYINTTIGVVKATRSGSFHVSNLFDEIQNTNQSIMTKLDSIENSLTTLESNLAVMINNAEANILSLMNSYYTNLYNAILALPDSITLKISTAAPDWISCAAQKITGVYPVGSKCR